MLHVPAERFTSDVAEIQGLYGAFTFPEKLLQKIWLRRDFDHRAARTLDGRTVRVVHPGKWNLLGGPDFRLARLRFDDGPEVLGDVELHLRASDWDAHHHAADPAYAGVVLHVVLFWPDPGHVTRAGNGAPIPVLPLLPLLLHDLEEYATDEAVEVLANRPAAALTDELALLPAPELRRLLEAQALARWRQKVHFARIRLEKLGWEGACHHAALEVLGFRYNRAPMLRIASRWLLAAWAAGEVDLEAAYSLESDAWSLQGVRPANYPRVRLRQYTAWAAARPAWPAALARLLDALPPAGPAADTRDFRRQQALPALRDRIATGICADTVGGGRLENLICDAFLPLAAARPGASSAPPRAPGAQPGHDHPAATASIRDHYGPASRSATGPDLGSVPASGPDYYAPWFHWFCGDLPPFVPAGLRHLSVCEARGQPLCHGLAQGLLGWLIEREVRR